MKYFTGREISGGHSLPLEHMHNLLFMVDNIADPLREWLNKPVHVTSGYRPKKYNRELVEQGLASPNSQHTRGLALDLTWEGIDERTVHTAYNWLRSFVPFNFRMIYYPGSKFVHMALAYLGRETALLYKLDSGFKKVG